MNLSGVEPQSYGITLNPQEKEALKLPLKFALYGDLSDDDFEQKVEQLNAKLRYHVHKVNSEADEEGEEQGTPEEAKRIAAIEAEAQKPLNGRDLNLGRLKVTEWPQNSCVSLPKATKPSQEAEIITRKDKYLKCFREHTRKFCNPKGAQRSNLTRDQKVGMKSLIQRSNKEVCVFC